jgi:hypothetical protein
MGFMAPESKDSGQQHLGTSKLLIPLFLSKFFQSYFLNFLSEKSEITILQDGKPEAKVSKTILTLANELMPII